MLLLKTKKIGDSIVFNSVKYTKVAKNYWKSEGREIFEHCLQVEIDIKECEDAQKNRKKTKVKEENAVRDEEREDN